MTDDPRLTELINRIRSGDREATGELVVRYGAEVKAAIRHTLNRGNPLGRLIHPSDILQSVMLLLLGATEDPARVENGRAYIEQMVNNRVLHHGRKRESLKRGGERAVGGIEAAAGVVDPSPSPSRVLILKEQMEALLKALPPSERAVAEGRLAERTWAEIAAGTGEKPDTVQKRFQRTLDLVAGSFSGATDK